MVIIMLSLNKKLKQIQTSIKREVYSASGRNTSLSYNTQNHMNIIVYKKTHILKESFKEERNLSNVIDNQCKKCKYLYICNGKYFCREKPCEFLDYDIEKYIKTYVENTLK